MAYNTRMSGETNGGKPDWRAVVPEHFNHKELALVKRAVDKSLANDERHLPEGVREIFAIVAAGHTVHSLLVAEALARTIEAK